MIGTNSDMITAWVKPLSPETTLRGSWKAAPGDESPKSRPRRILPGVDLCFKRECKVFVVRDRNDNRLDIHLRALLVEPLDERFEILLLCLIGALTITWFENSSGMTVI